MWLIWDDSGSYAVICDYLTSTSIEDEECSASVSDKLNAGGG